MDLPDGFKPFAWASPTSNGGATVSALHIARSGEVVPLCGAKPHRLATFSVTGESSRNECTRCRETLAREEVADV